MKHSTTLWKSSATMENFRYIWYVEWYQIFDFPDINRAVDWLNNFTRLFLIRKYSIIFIMWRWFASLAWLIWISFWFWMNPITRVMYRDVISMTWQSLNGTIWLCPCNYWTFFCDWISNNWNLNYFTGKLTIVDPNQSVVVKCTTSQIS